MNEFYKDNYMITIKQPSLSGVSSLPPSVHVHIKTNASRSDIITALLHAHACRRLLRSYSNYSVSEIEADTFKSVQEARKGE